MSEILKEIGLSISKLRVLIHESRKDQARISSNLKSLTLSLEALWQNEDVHALLLLSAQQIHDALPFKGPWDELVMLLASGKIPSIAAQAEDCLLQSISESLDEDEQRQRGWVSNGAKYSQWLARGIVELSAGKDATERPLAQLCGKSLSLGYSDEIVDEITTGLVIAQEQNVGQYHRIFSKLRNFEQRYFLQSLIRALSRKYQLDKPPVIEAKSSWQSVADLQSEKAIGGVAALLKSLIDQNPAVSDTLVEWLTKSPFGVNLSRSLIAALPLSDVKTTLDRNWEQFGSKLYIKHTSIVQQEAITQVLLICAGYVHRSSSSDLVAIARSSTHSVAISERLERTSPRARFLGMVVGEAMSVLMDDPDKRLKFDIDDLKTEESKWYRSLVNIKVDVGSTRDLAQLDQSGKAKNTSAPVSLVSQKPKSQISKPKIIEIIEESEDEDLIPHEKPDSDPEDEEEDATLVDRNKPKAPVYIRDLIAALQDSENHERHLLALNTASSLIRRKADFGNELKERSEELAGVLVSLHDHLETENWQDIRLEAMISILVAQPKIIGPWYARTFFSGDYSVSQRGSVLTALGLGARELAGLGERTEKQFPTKTLPERLRKLYADPTEIDTIASQMQQTILHPSNTTKRRRKIVRNDLLGIVAESFFFPLTGYWYAQSQMSGARHIATSPYLLPLFLKTLSIILSAAGPAVLTLHEMTSEFWQLLLAVCPLAIGDATAMESVLFAFLTIMNINEDKNYLAMQNRKELLETQAWVSSIFDKLSDADKEGERCKVLAAGVLFAIKEVAEKHQQTLLGSVFDF